MATQRTRVADYIIEFLAANGVERVFELSGGMIVHLLDALCRLGHPPVTSVHHEQAAAFAVDAVGKLTGRPAVALATSGPGATNLLTGIATCYFDSSPGLFLTGQVNRREQKGDRPIRQLGFQETDIVAMARPVTKAAWAVRSPEEVPARLRQAFALTTSGRPGPVLLDLPMDVQGAMVEAELPTAVADRSDDLPPPDPAAIERLLAALSAAQRPLILAGAGVRCALCTSTLRAFAHHVGIPVVYSLHAVDAMEAQDPLRVGLIGTYGNRWANLALARSDLLVVLGSRLDIRQTGSDTAFLSRGRTIFHVDCEAAEINHRVTGCEAVVASLQRFLPALQEAAGSRAFPDWAAWSAEIAELRRAWPDTEELRGVAGINPNAFMHALAAASSSAAAYVVDVGQHQMWAAQSLDLGPEQRFVTSGGMGSMGYSLPAAIGVSCSVRPRPVVVVAGDGGFQCNLQELQTVAHNRLPLKMVVINNRCHGMVRQFQQSYFECRYQSTFWGYSAPDFARVAGAFGISARSLQDPSQALDALRWLWRDADEPALLQVMVDTETNVYPKIAFGRPLSEMEPTAKPQAMGGSPAEAASEGGDRCG